VRVVPGVRGPIGKQIGKQVRSTTSLEDAPSGLLTRPPCRLTVGLYVAGQLVGAREGQTWRRCVVTAVVPTPNGPLIQMTEVVMASEPTSSNRIGSTPGPRDRR
jgi:hypothetical protein